MKKGATSGSGTSAGSGGTATSLSPFDAVLININGASGGTSSTTSLFGAPGGNAPGWGTGNSINSFIESNLKKEEH